MVTEPLGQLQAPPSLHVPRLHPERTSQWQRLHTVQGLPRARVGKSQVSHRIHGVGNISRVLCQSKWKGPRPWTCEGFGRRCKTDRQGQNIQNKCTVSRSQCPKYQFHKPRLTSQQPILPCRRCRPRGSALHRPSPRRWRVRHHLGT